MSPQVSIELPFLGAVTAEGAALLQLCFVCHAAAARANDNLSGAIVQNAMRGSGSFRQAVCAGVLSTGDIHAPIGRARAVLRGLTASEAEEAVRSGLLIAGYGNAFFKDRIDPSFQPLADALRDVAPDLWETIVGIQSAIDRAGHALFPNAAILTAAVCEIVGVPDGIEDSLFIMARLPVWAQQAAAQKRGELWA